MAATLVPTAVRVLVILLAVAGSAGQLAYLDALWWHSLGLTAAVSRNASAATITLLSAHALVSFACSLLSVAMVLTERPRQVAARALAVAFGAWSYLMAYPGVALLFRPPTPGLSREAFEAHFLLVEVLGLVGLLRFTAIFPRVLSSSEMQPLPTLPAALLPFHHVAVHMRRARAPLLAGLGVLVVLWSWTLVRGGALSDAGLSRGMDLVRFCAAGLIVMNLRRAWGSATEGDRDALTWLLVGLATLLSSLLLLIGGNVLVAVTGFPEPGVAWRPILLDLGLVGFLGGVSMSVLDRGRRDPAETLRFVTSSTTVATGCLFLAAALEALFGGGIVSGLSFRRGVGTAFAFAIVLATYRNLTTRIALILPI